jgi:hypothetical protein
MACGVPVAIIGVADNQRAVVEGIERRAAGVCLGWHDTLDLLAAADSIQALLGDPTRLAELAGKGRAAVDGRGVYRVLDALLDVIDNRDPKRTLTTCTVASRSVDARLACRALAS